MTAKDLMLGDWLRFKPDGVPCRVTEINNEVMITAIDPVKLSVKKRHVRYWEPIPLTDVILEKNGFELHEGENELYGVTTSPYYAIDGSPYIYCDGNPFAVWFDKPVDVKYVHQLQNVLRLCGVEKKLIIKD